MNVGNVLDHVYVKMYKFIFKQKILKAPKQPQHQTIITGNVQPQ